MNTKGPQQVVLMYHGIVSHDSVTPPCREGGAHLYDVPFKKFKRDWIMDFDLGLMYGLAVSRTGTNNVNVDGSWFDGGAGNWTIAITTLVYL